MNERIETLAKAAGYDMINKAAMRALGFDVEKFAQLIVAECVDKIETYRIPVGNSAAGEMACEWTYDALKEISDEIQEHFGVEE